MSEPLSYALEGKTAVVTMDDGKANALSEAMIAGLLDAVTRAEAEASALALLGRPERFCGGFDLRVMMSSPDAARGLLRQGSELLMRLYGCAVPLVIGCTGHALAGGALVLLTGDVRVGAAGAFRLGLNEVQIGLPVPVLATELARDRLLPTELTRATLGAHIYAPDDARRAGYLDEVVAPEQVRERALAEAARLGALERRAFEASKLRLRRATIELIRSTLEEDLRTLLGG
ncbi:MAG TPA: crotonase/enoyl-CoA hydratase family protein [Polyangiaceae bacterium]|nr:crotonase/enoyl-CoA hydratase family protein [Polyangiaceae bacterium]